MKSAPQHHRVSLCPGPAIEDGLTATKVDVSRREIVQTLVICDNAGHYRSKAVRAYLENSRIKLVFLPAYAPNLNLIERLWKFLKKQVLYNRYYESFGDSRTAREDFFQNAHRYQRELRSLLTENFAIIGQ